MKFYHHAKVGSWQVFHFEKVGRFNAVKGVPPLIQAIIAALLYTIFPPLLSARCWLILAKCKGDRHFFQSHKRAINLVPQKGSKEK